MWALTDASLLLSPIRTRRHNGVKRWERNSSGNERTKEWNRERERERERERQSEGVGGEARGDRRHFHIS